MRWVANATQRVVVLGVSLDLELTVPWAAAQKGSTNPIPISPAGGPPQECMPLGPREPGSPGVTDFPGKHAHPVDPDRTQHRV